MKYWDYEDKWYEVVADIFPELVNNELVSIRHASMFGIDNFLSWSDDTLVSEIIESYNKGKRIFVYECLREGLFVRVLTKFTKIINKVNLPDISYIWITGDPMGEQAANDRLVNKQFHVYGTFYFEYLGQKIFPKYTKPYNVGYKEKTFLCLNNVIRQSRVDLLEYMLEYDLVKDSYYSFIGGSRGTISTNTLVDTLESYDKYTNIVNNRNILPLNLTSKLYEGEKWTADLIEEDSIFYENSYFSVVPETLFYSMFMCPLPRIGHVETVNGAMITEKTYKAIAMKHPFILLARPYTLRMLRERGYKTFSPFIDESYDEILDDALRLKMVADEIHRLSKTDLVEFTYQVRDIVEHNYEHFWSRTVFDPNKIKT